MTTIPEEFDPTAVQSIRGVERALAVLSLFASAEETTLGVTEISQALGISKAVVHRILTALRSKGFIDMDATSHRYMLGPEILILGLTYLDRVDTRGIAHAAMDELLEITNETVTFSVRVGWSRVYIDQITPERDVKMVVQLGKPFPLHTGASSKAMLAALPDIDQEEYLREHELVALTERSITEPERLRAELSMIRERGYAQSFGERDEGAGSVAAPFFGYDAKLVGVLSVCGPIERFRAEADDAAIALTTTVAALSRRLGYQPAS